MKITIELDDFELQDGCSMKDFKSYFEEEIETIIFDNLADSIECSNVNVKFNM